MLQAEAESKRDPGLFTILVRVRKPDDLAVVRARIAAALAEAAKTPDRSGSAGRDQVAPALRVRRLARTRRRRRRRGRHGRGDHRPPRFDQRAVRRLRPPHAGRPPARRGEVLPAEQRDGDHPRDGDQEMTTEPIASSERAGTDPASSPRSSLTAADVARADEPKASPAPIRRRCLHSPSNPLVALRFVFRAGSQNDPPGKEGLAALTAAMVAEGGTKSLTYDQLLEAFYPMAASLDGACRKEVTVFSGVVHRDNLASLHPARDRDDHPAAVRPRGLRAAPQRGARLRHQDPARQQRRRAGQVDPAGRALQGSPVRPSRPGDRPGPEGDHARRRQGVSPPALHAARR